MDSVLSFNAVRAQYNYLWLFVFSWFKLGYGDLGPVSIYRQSFQVWYFRYKDKTVVSYFHNGSSYTGKTTSLYWNSPLQPSINEYATAKNYCIGKWCNCTIVFCFVLDIHWVPFQDHMIGNGVLIYDTLSGYVGRLYIDDGYFIGKVLSNGHFYTVYKGIQYGHTSNLHEVWCFTNAEVCMKL